MIMKFRKDIGKQIKEYLVDTSGVLLFQNPVFGTNEYFIAGLELDEIISTRIGMSTISLLSSRPYGKFREYWAKICKTSPGDSNLRKYLTDVSANIVFYVPIYGGILYTSDVSSDEVGIALSTATALAVVIGRPYGWFLDKWRKIFKVKPVLGSFHDEKTGKLDLTD